jgi:uncharacterized membrane protein YheB (UPF0754 family)
MTKSEKKEIIKKLLNNALVVTDENELQKILESVIREIYSAGYPIQRYPVVSSAVDLFVKDFVVHYEKRVGNQMIDNDFIQMSKVGLLTLIDMSLLEA